MTCYKKVNKLLSKYGAARSKEASYKRECSGIKDELDAELKALGIEEHSSGGQTVRYICQKGNVQYKDIPALKKIDLDKYRGADVKYLKVIKSAKY